MAASDLVSPARRAAIQRLIALADPDGTSSWDPDLLATRPDACRQVYRQAARRRPLDHPDRPALDRAWNACGMGAP